MDYEMKIGPLLLRGFKRVEEDLFGNEVEVARQTEGTECEY